MHIPLQQNSISSRRRPEICGILSSITSVLSVADSYSLFSLGCPSLTETDACRRAEIFYLQNWVTIVEQKHFVSYCGNTAEPELRMTSAFLSSICKPDSYEYHKPLK